jgi:opacity protein-like surface antigen
MGGGLMGHARGSYRFAMFVAVLVGAMLGAAPAHAQSVPDKVGQEILIKATLLTFNDANVTGNYTVLHAKLSKPFRDQFSPEKLKAVFKEFADKHIDFDLIAAKPPVSSEEAVVNDQGVLKLYGYFDTKPSRLNYQLEFIRSDGDWKAIKINVDLKKMS